MINPLRSSVVDGPVVASASSVHADAAEQSRPAARAIPGPVRSGATVVHLLRGTEGGGIVTAIRNIAPPMMAAGWDVQFLVLAQGKAVDMLRHAELAAEVRPLSRLQRLRGISGLLRESSPSIIHCHNPASHLLAARAARALGSRVMRTVHADMFFEMQGTLPAWKIAMWKRLMRQALAQADVVACVSPHLVSLLPGADRLPKDRLLVLANGYDPAVIEANAHGLAPDLAAWVGDGPLVLSMGRMVTVKNYPMLLRAFAIAVREVPYARLLLAGSGPLEGSLQRLIGELGLEQHVRLLPWVDQIAPLLKRSNVIAISSFSECCPMLVLEAMTVRTPIVATAVGGIPFMVDDGRSGVLVPSDDPGAMGTALVRVLADRNLRDRLGGVARDVLDARFDFRVAAANTARIYNRLLSGERPTQADVVG